MRVLLPLAGVGLFLGSAGKKELINFYPQKRSDSLLGIPSTVFALGYSLGQFAFSVIIFPYLKSNSDLIFNPQFPKNRKKN